MNADEARASYRARVRAQTRERFKAPRLATLAKMIEAEWPSLEAEVVEGYCNTDRKPKGVRWRIPGKGRTGNRLIVRERVSGTVVLDHNSAETYRFNHEVVDWMERRRRAAAAEAHQ